MTPDQKIGAVITFGMSGTTISQSVIDAIEKYHCSGIRPTPYCRAWCTSVDPFSGKKVVHIKNERGTKDGIAPVYCPAEQYAEMITKLQKMASSRPLGIGLHISFDQEGGSSADFRMGGVNIFPKPMGIRATDDSQNAYKIALAVAKQAKAAGLSWIHSPVFDINSNPNNPEISTRSYSDRVDEVIEYAEQALKGFKDAGIIATAKHFPGRGNGGQDSHFKLPVLDMSLDLMKSRELLPYKVLISKGLVPTVMIAHTIYTCLDDKNIATVSKRIIEDLLRGEIGFRGVITTDSMTMAGIALKYRVDEACAKALQAGADIVLMKADNHLQGDVFNTIKRYVDEGKISEKELEEKIYRILSLKQEYGILNYKACDSSQKVHEVLRDPQIVQLSREMAKKSVIVSKNSEQLLPLPKDAPVLVIEQALEDAPSDVWWHSGMLSEFCQSYNPKADLLEIGVMADNEDIQRIKACIDNYDYIVVTNFYFRSKLANNELINMLLESGEKVIVVNNTPYKLNTPDAVGTVITTFATSPKNLEVVAGVIFGEIKPEGVWPIENNEICEDKNDIALEYIKVK
jgi:beta-N-acetylhexosaminidase